MAEEPFYLPNRKPEPPRQPQPGEKLFEFLVGNDRYIVELRDHGQWGVDAQFYRNEEFCYSRRMDNRALAVLWAEAIRKGLEKEER